MNEKTLLPCPFCAGVNFSEHYEDRYGHIVRCTRCGGMIASHMGMKDTKHNWNTRTQPLTEPQQPLTLEELREMKGEPVWVVPINLHEWLCDRIDGKPAYGLVRKSWVRIWREETADLVHSDFDFEDYNKTWTAYRQKPTEG